jgi:ABC-type multidrug transport system fused ATPase/permease subunit
MLTATALGLVVPTLVGRGVDAIVLDGSLGRLNRIVFELIGLFAAVVTLSYYQNYLFGVTNAQLLCTLRQSILHHLVGLGHDFYESRRVGDLLSRIGADLTTIQGALAAIPAGIRAAILFGGAVVFLLILQTKLTLVSLMVIPPVAIGSVWFGRWMRVLATKQQDALADATALAEEVLNGIRTVQSFGREPYESERYGFRLALLKNFQIKAVRIGGGFAAVLSFGGFFAFTLVLWYGGKLLLKQQLSPGDLTSFLLYSFFISSSVNTFGSLYAGYQSLMGASLRVFELLDTPPSIVDSPAGISVVRPKGRITFQNVSFQYPTTKGRTVLSDIQLEIGPGEVIGFVGPSGAGKSTLYSLLYRFYDPSSGSISIDGVDLVSIPLKSLREHIGIVPQEIFLFTGTIAQNIGYGKPQASEDEIRLAAISAGADEFIQRLPRRYEETVGHRGLRLSAGQRQRIAIARAFLKDPAILLLDEATSSLDPDSEEIVRQALSRLLHGRTTLVIAHRMATARHATRIIVLERGRIIGSGTHDVLFASNETYRRYLKLQTTRDTSVPGEANSFRDIWRGSGVCPATF